MRVLLVTDWNRGQGGAEAYVSWLRSGLEDAGDEVRLVTSSAGSAGNGKADYIAYGTESVAAQAFLQIVNPFAVRTVRRAVREFEPDVVFVNMFAHHLSPAILHAAGKAPIVLAVSDYKCVCPIGSKLRPDGVLCAARAGWICHEAGCVSLPHWIRDRPRYELLSAGVARVARVVACSEWVRQELARSGIESECLHPPVPPPSRRYARARSAAPRVLYCGRLDIEKGVDCLINAFATTAAENPNASLRLAGRGPERDRLEALTKELKIERQVAFLGWLEPDEVERELSSAWILAAPSLWAEPLGLVALEAIVRGVPVVASASGGFVETVEEGITGMLIPNGDVAALVTTLRSVLNGERFSNGIPDSAVRNVRDRHDVGRHVVRMRAIFNDVISGTALI